MMLVVAAVAAAVGTGQREGRLHSLDTCYQWTGDTMCMENVQYPKCPRTFYDKSLVSCKYLMNYFGMDPSIMPTVNWWTSVNCTKHRTLCQINDSQYEDEAYDFTQACEQTVRTEFSYKYSYYALSENGTRVLVFDNREGSAVLQPNSEPEVTFSLKYRAQTIFEELQTILLLERDDNGYVTRRSEGAVGTAMDSSNQPGLYAQFHRSYLQWDYKTQTYKTYYDPPTDYHVSNIQVLSACKNWNGVQQERHSWGVKILGIAIGVIAVIAGVTVGCHFYLMKRREYFAGKILKAQEIKVVEATRVQAHHSPTMGQVVRGVPVHDIDFHECEAAPLPPQHGGAVPTPPDEQI
eukprot:TRINITY_DN11476_c0_g1_i1.p1 TRINITY_DN11476_c0_g1~~TRINITY_DN11476_c0_g1_i1.p1  ORF type:complete len:363 (+),score=98.96 TRINITY_DN11476_c0_g1_i1:41-1090(+)